jgi:hypothetical protein
VRAWHCLRPDQQAGLSRTILAEPSLKAAAQGERDPEHLLDAILMSSWSRNPDIRASFSRAQSSIF